MELDGEDVRVLGAAGNFFHKTHAIAMNCPKENPSPHPPATFPVHCLSNDVFLQY